jgi:hypothetical protein
MRRKSFYTLNCGFTFSTLNFKFSPCSYVLVPWPLTCTKDYVRNYKKNMQNKPNFRKSQVNVTGLLTREYVHLDTWSSGKNKPNSNPIQTQFQRQYMKNTGRHKPFGYETDPNGIDKTSCILSTNLVNISKYSRSNKMQLSEKCCHKFDEGVQICMETK